MGERKVLNKYYPPDFDPSKLPKLKKPKNQQMNIRMMLPMSIRCTTCGNYIGKGTKFNSRKEDVVGEKYLGIQVFRFYFKCTNCSAELAMKTDPKNSDYTVEAGATRNFEPWRESDEVGDEERRRKEAEEMGDAMKSLENRTLDSKREMDIMAALDEMKSMKSRHATVSVDEMLGALKCTSERKEEKMEEEDEALIRSIAFPGSKDYVRRIEDVDDEDDDDEDDVGDHIETPSGNALKRKVAENFIHTTKASTTKASTVGAQKESNGAKVIFNSSAARVLIVKKTVPTGTGNNSEKASDGKTQHDPCTTSTVTRLQSLLRHYDSDEDD